MTRRSGLTILQHLTITDYKECSCLQNVFGKLKIVKIYIQISPVTKREQNAITKIFTTFIYISIHTTFCSRYMSRTFNKSQVKNLLLIFLHSDKKQHYLQTPTTPQARRGPALPVFKLSSFPPLPTSSSFSCTCRQKLKCIHTKS